MQQAETCLKVLTRARGDEPVVVFSAAKDKYVLGITTNLSPFILCRFL